MTIRCAFTALAAFLGLVCTAGSGCQKIGDSRAGDPMPLTITTSSGIDMVLIPAGSFTMGSRRGKEDEQPVHRVQVDAFLMDKHEVTQAAWDKVAEQMGLPNPSHFKGPDLPVEQVSWVQAARYCNARSQAEGLEPCYDEDTTACNFNATGYRLPTEAEWEYACRAGSDSEYAFGNDERGLGEYSWFADNAAKKTHPVGQKKPNAWGLYDMHGNVAEWCNDNYDKSYYAASPDHNPRGLAEGDKNVLRGGAWNSARDGLRSAARVGEAPGFQDACFARDAIGFRCVRKAPEEKSAP
jgi:formylglycine-generating enzyme required for sulfatase activity